MKTLIISDLHLRHNIAEDIIDNVEHDNIVFLGDYFDNFHDTPIQNEEAAEWLKNSLNDPNRVHLLGNHDHSYLNKYFRCSGWTKEKNYVINKVLDKSDWAKLKFYHVVDDWLLTHAGLTYNLFKRIKSFHHISANLVTTNLNKVVQALDVEIAYFNEKSSPFQRLVAAGRHRGGRAAEGGITWCDINEFHPLPNVNQIFGHSVCKIPKLITCFKGKFGSKKETIIDTLPLDLERVDDSNNIYSYNYCIDNYQNTYVILNNGEFNIYERKTGQ